VTEHAAELDIVLLFLPPYSPQFNPVEFIWKTIKSVISGLFLLCREHLKAAAEEIFMAESVKQSYAEGWKRTFLMDYDYKKLGS
jgi:transposase